MNLGSLLLVLVLLTSCSAAPLDKAYHALSFTGSATELDDSEQSFWYVGSNKWIPGDHKRNGKENLMFYIRFNISALLRR